MTMRAPQTRPAQAAPARPILVLALMSACVVLAVALVAAVNLAIPKLSESSLHPTATQMLWIVDAYVIVFACLLIPSGAFGDRHGRKEALLAGLAIYGGGCLVAGFAPSVGVLLAGRAISGLGAALIMPATLSLVVQSFLPERRPWAIAIWTTATGIAGVVGNVGGGLVLQYLDWRAMFWILAPVALILLAASARFAPRGERHPANLDLPGSGLLTLCFLALLYGIIEGPDDGWASGTVLGAFCVAAVVLAVFVVVDLRAAHPLIDPRLFRQPGLRAGVTGVGLTFFGLFALFYVNAQFLQYAKGYSPLLTGVAIVPLALGMLATSRASVTLTARAGPTPVVAAGLVVLAGGLAGLSFVSFRTPYLVYAVLLVVVSLGMGLSVPPQSTAIIHSLPASRAGLGSGLNSATRELGSALGVAIAGTILDSQFFARLPAAISHGTQSAPQALAAAQHLGHGDRATVISAFTSAMSIGYRAVAIAVLAVAILVVWWFRQSQRQSQSRAPGNGGVPGEAVRDPAVRDGAAP